MTRTHRVLWGEGLFLRPQHFQQQERFLESRVARGLTWHHLHPWGVQAVQLDPAALAQGLLQCERLQLVFQDGTSFDAPQDEPLPPPRSLEGLPGLEGEPLVWACLPPWHPGGGNSAEPDQDPGRPVRYRLDRVTLPDLHTEALEAEVTVLNPNVRLRVGAEDRDGQAAVAIARLRRDGSGAWAVDPSYLPPLLALQAAPALLTTLKGLAAMLLAKSRALTASHRERARAVLDYGAAEVGSFWLLHCVNRSGPVLAHFLDHPQIHPERLYRHLAQLAGELLTFSSTRGLEDIPPYRHTDLGPTFQRLTALIRDLLDTVIASRCALVPLRELRPSFHSAHLDDDRLDGKCELYLCIRSDGAPGEILETVPLKLKVGCPDDVDRMLHSALPGVRLTHVTRTPPGVPVRLGNHYFALEPHGPIYERMLAARSVCLYAPSTLPPMELELIIAFP